MRATTGAVVLGLLGSTLLLAACGDAEDDTAGYGHVEVGDLPDDLTEHFTAEPAEVAARLVLRENGCVNVEIDGVEHVPLWPDGTSVEQDGEDPVQYTVELSSGIELAVTTAGGDGFTANGVVDTASTPLTTDDEGGKVGGFVAYCEAPGAPVAFFDAASFQPTGA
jgi:hypothetical protein